MPRSQRKKEKPPGNDPVVPDLDPDSEDALKKALVFLKYRPRSTGETRRRMARWGFGKETSESVIAYLVDRNYLDDTRFAQLYYNELLEGDLGYYRIRSKLLERKLDKGLVEELLEGYPHDTEEERALRQAQGKVTRLSGEERDRRRKLESYLMRKGFSRGVAEKACVRALGRVDTEFGPE